MVPLLSQGPSTLEKATSIGTGNIKNPLESHQRDVKTTPASTSWFSDPRFRVSGFAHQGPELPVCRAFQQRWRSVTLTMRPSAYSSAPSAPPRQENLGWEQPGCTASTWSWGRTWGRRNEDISQVCSFPVAPLALQRPRVCVVIIISAVRKHT